MLIGLTVQLGLQGLGVRNKTTLKFFRWSEVTKTSFNKENERKVINEILRVHNLYYCRTTIG